MFSLFLLCAGHRSGSYCVLDTGLSALLISILFKKAIFIYMAALGLCCSMQIL